jgi:hypothetical protein
VRVPFWWVIFLIREKFEEGLAEVRVEGAKDGNRQDNGHEEGI